MKSPLSYNAIYRLFVEQNRILGFLMIFSLSFPSQWINVTLTAWGISWLLEVVASRRICRPRFHLRYLAIYLLLLLYIIMALSLVYTDNKLYAARLFERRLAFLILPFMALFGLSDSYSRLTPYIKAFVAGNVISLIVSVLYPFTIIIFTNNFADNDLMGQVRLLLQEHYVRPTELGIFCLMGWLLTVYLFRSNLSESRRISPVLFQFFMGVYIGVIFVWMWLLGCRLNMLMALFLVLFMLQTDLWKNRKTLAIVTMVAGATLLWGVYISHPRFKLVQLDNIHFTSDFRLQDPRMGIWYSAVQILKEDHTFLTGVGVGDVRDELVKRYQDVFATEEHILERVTREKRHVHNNFLEMNLEMGLPALLLLLFILVWPLVRSSSHPYFWLVFSLWLCWLMRMVFDAPFVNLREIACFSLTWMFFTTFDKEHSKKLF